jgi:cob(I)alamin adenosyltransferase
LFGIGNYELEGGSALIQVYTGNGKGKTTAALGLAIRAAGAGYKVYICQFLKGRYCSELTSLRKLKNIRVEQFGRRLFMRGPCAKKDIDLAKRGLEAVREAIKTKKCDIIVLDEINLALKLKLLKLKDVVSLIKSAPKKTELVLTGRHAHHKIMKIADLVSFMQDRKHYYKKGIKARRGIEF